MSNPDSWLDYLGGGHPMPISKKQSWGDYLKASAYNAVPAVIGNVRNYIEQAEVADPVVQYMSEYDSDPNVRRQALERKQRVFGQIENMPATAAYAVSHPRSYLRQSFGQDPIGTIGMVRGATGLVRHGLGAVEGAAARTGAGLYPGSAGAQFARGTQAVAGAGRNVLGTAEAVMDAPMTLARNVSGLRPTPRSIFAPTQDNPFALSSEAEDALSRSGLSADQQQRIRTNPTLLKEWERTSQFGKNGKPVGVSPASLRHAVLSHSGVSPENISFSAATGDRPVNAQVAQKMNNAARSELPAEPAPGGAPPEPKKPKPIKMGGIKYFFRNGAWEHPNFGQVPELEDILNEEHNKKYGFYPTEESRPAVNSRDVSDIAHDVLDNSDEVINDSIQNPPKSNLQKLGRFAVDTGAASVASWLASRFGPYASNAAAMLGAGAADYFVPKRGKIPAGNPLIEKFGAPPVKPPPAYGPPLLYGIYSAANRNEEEQPEPAPVDEGGEYVIGDIGPPVSVNTGQPPEKAMARPAVGVQPPKEGEDGESVIGDIGQWRGGRAAYKAGGKVGTSDIEHLISALMNKAKQAKKVSNKATEPLLNAKDDAIASALAVAQKAI